MFRDSHGVVHTLAAADPTADLPASAATALAALLDPAGDLEAAQAGCEAARELVERWQDAFFAALPDEVDLAEEARWAEQAGTSLAEVEAAYDGADDTGDGPHDVASPEWMVAEPAPDPDLDLDLDPTLGVDLDLPFSSSSTDLDLALLDAQPEPARRLPEELVSVLERELLLLPLRVRLEALVAAAELLAGWEELLADHEKLLGHLVLAHGAAAAAAPHVALAGQHAALHRQAGPGHRTPG